MLTLSYNKKKKNLNRVTPALSAASTHNTLVEVPLDGDQHIAQCGAEERRRVHVLSCPHMMAHLHQHVERVEAVDFIAQSDQTVQFCLDAVEDLIHHLTHHIFAEKEPKKETWMVNNFTRR